MKTIIISEEKLNLLSESAKAELTMLENKEASLQKQCKDLIASFNSDKIEHKTDTSAINFSIQGKDYYQGFLTIERWHKTAGEQWGNCAGTYYLVNSIGRKYVKLEANHYRTNERNWSEYQTIEITDFLTILIAWKAAEDCDEPADQDILLRKLSAKIADYFE